MMCLLTLQDGVSLVLLQTGSDIILQNCPMEMMAHSCTSLQSFWTGALMGGMTVTATFTDSTTETATWVGLGLGAGQVVGTNWSITESGDTSIASWTITNNTGQGITQLVFAGCPGNTVFDRTFPSPGTPGSGIGVDFVVTGGTFSGAVVASYQVPANLPSQPPVGDIWTNMTVQFFEVGGMTSGTTLLFRADTDGCIDCGTLTTQESAAHFCETFTDTSTGSTLAGTTVVATFADTTTETATWTDLGSGSGSAVGTNWSLAVNGDTLSNNWTLTNSTGQGITKLVINADLGNSVFNTTLGVGKTPGTGTGLTFKLTGGSFTGSLVYSYTGVVALPGQNPKGDVYTTLTLDFTIALGNGQTITFLSDTEGCGTGGGFGSVSTATLLWHVSAEKQMFQDFAGTIPVTDGSNVARWNDLTGNSHHLLCNYIPSNNTPNNCFNYQATGTGTGKPDLQVSYAAGFIFGFGQGWLDCFGNSNTGSAFNFFQPTRQLTYAMFIRGIAGKANYAILDDGNGTSNGFCIGYGNPDLDTNQDTGHGGSGADSHYLVALDGTATIVNSGIISSVNGVLVVTYDGQAGGATNFYFGETNASPPFYTILTGGPFSHVGLQASGGFAAAGTPGNVDPGRMNTAHGGNNPNSISLCEMAIWEGILGNSDITQLVINCKNFWGFS